MITKINPLTDRINSNLQAYKRAHDAWVADKDSDWDIHENYVEARNTLEMGAYDDETALLAAIATLQAEIARLRDALKFYANKEFHEIYKDESGEYASIIERDGGKTAAAALADVESASTSEGEQ